MTIIWRMGMFSNTGLREWKRVNGENYYGFYLSMKMLSSN